MIVIEAGHAPEDKPRVGAYPAVGTVAASSAAAGYAAANAALETTVQFWRPTALPATWTLTYFGARRTTYVGIAAHDLGSRGVTVALAVDVGAGWVTVASHTPTDDSPILFLIAPRMAVAVRLSFSGGTIPTVGVIMSGDEFVFPQRAAYVGRKDFRDQIIEEFTTNQSDGGNFLGRYVARRQQRVSLTVKNLSESFKAAYLDDLIAHLTLHPGFVADRPVSAPKSLIYGYLAQKPVPEREIPNSAASIAVSMEFIGHVV